MATTQRFMRIDRLVSNLGLSSRREVNAFIRKSVTVDGIRPPSQSLRVDPARLLIDGKPAVDLIKPLLGVALFKPGLVQQNVQEKRWSNLQLCAAGLLCSRARDGKAGIVYDLLPAEWARRRPGLEICGRLDKEASGLVLLSQDGGVNFAAIARGHEREYEVELRDPATAETVALFASGTMVLRGNKQSPAPLLPAELRPTGDGRRATVVLREGTREESIGVVCFCFFAHLFGRALSSAARHVLGGGQRGAEHSARAHCGSAPGRSGRGQVSPPQRTGAGVAQNKAMNVSGFSIVITVFCSQVVQRLELAL